MVGEENLGHAGAGDEVDDVGFGDGASDRLERSSNRQILIEQA
jgi:hypothetical protein